MQSVKSFKKRNKCETDIRCRQIDVEISASCSTSFFLSSLLHFPSFACFCFCRPNPIPFYVSLTFLQSVQKKLAQKRGKWVTRTKCSFLFVFTILRAIGCPINYSIKFSVVKRIDICGVVGWAWAMKKKEEQKTRQRGRSLALRDTKLLRIARWGISLPEPVWNLPPWMKTITGYVSFVYWYCKQFFCNSLQVKNSKNTFERTGVGEKTFR